MMLKYVFIISFLVEAVLSVVYYSQFPIIQGTELNVTEFNHSSLVQCAMNCHLNQCYRIFFDEAG